MVIPSSRFRKTGRSERLEKKYSFSLDNVVVVDEYKEEGGEASLAFFRIYNNNYSSYYYENLPDKEVVIVPLSKDTTIEKVLKAVWKSDGLAGITVRSYAFLDTEFSHRAGQLFQAVSKAIEENEVSQIPETKGRFYITNIKYGYRFMPPGKEPEDVVVDVFRQGRSQYNTKEFVPGDPPEVIDVVYFSRFQISVIPDPLEPEEIDKTEDKDWKSVPFIRSQRKKDQEKEDKLFALTKKTIIPVRCGFAENREGTVFVLTTPVDTEVLPAYFNYLLYLCAPDDLEDVIAKKVPQVTSWDVIYRVGLKSNGKSK